MGFSGPIFASAAVGDDTVVSGMLDPKYATDFMQQMMDVNSPAVVPEVQEFGKVMKAAGLQYNADHVNVLEALWVLKQGIEKAQSLETEAVVSAMENMDFNTVYGPGRFAGKDPVAGITLGQNRLMLAPIPFSRLMNGQWEFEWLPAPTN
jgi:ABC-type branched-subunit amino acid transport system substrate-binding protein